MEIIFLGTSSMVPTKDRNQSGILISYKDHGILVDCGEGIQRQMKKAGIPITKITKILISHWHGDHVFGLPGVISTLGASEYNKTLEIYGPKGTLKHFEAMFDAFVFDRRIKMEIKEIKEGKLFENKEYFLEAYNLDHGTISLGYNFVEKDKRRINIKKINKLKIPEGPLIGKLQNNEAIEFKGKIVNPDDVTYIEDGKKISIIADTAPCNNCYKLAENADILISEATYTSKLEQKGEEYYHMTAKQAALIANKANVKKLYLTHLSARYKTKHEIEEDALNYFQNVEVADDFMKIKL
ncbi:MAG: ribonuclease Z [Nanoarchaeota archaeon]